MTGTLDFKLGYLYRELSDQIATIAEGTDNTREIVTQRLLELLGAPAAKPPVQHALKRSRYFVERSTVSAKEDERLARIRERQRVWAANKRAELHGGEKAELVARVKKMAKTMSVSQIATELGKSKSAMYGFLSKHKIKTVGSKQTSPSEFWNKLTPEQRSAEMMRRRKVAAENRSKEA